MPSWNVTDNLWYGNMDSRLSPLIAEMRSPSSHGKIKSMAPEHQLPVTSQASGRKMLPGHRISWLIFSRFSRWTRIKRRHGQIRCSRAVSGVPSHTVTLTPLGSRFLSYNIIKHRWSVHSTCFENKSLETYKYTFKPLLENAPEKQECWIVPRTVIESNALSLYPPTRNEDTSPR